MIVACSMQKPVPHSWIKVYPNDRSFSGMHANDCHQPWRDYRINMSTLARQPHHPDCHPSSFKVNISSVMLAMRRPWCATLNLGMGQNQTQPSKIVGKWVPNGTLVKMSSNSSNKFNRAASLSVILSWHPIVPIKKNQQNGQHVGIWMDNFFFSGHKFLQFATWCDAYE